MGVETFDIEKGFEMSALSLSDIGLFKGIMAKMSWLDQRQKTLAQNVANADTPNYQPRDLKSVDFAQYMNMGAGAGGQLGQASTNPMHLGGAAGREYNGAKDFQQRQVFESSFDDNGVVLEEQMMKASKNASEYQIVTNLYRRQVGMIKIALGTAR